MTIADAIRGQRSADQAGRGDLPVPARITTPARLDHGGSITFANAGSVSGLAAGSITVGPAGSIAYNGGSVNGNARCSPASTPPPPARFRSAAPMRATNFDFTSGAHRAVWGT
jgi:hypothetical protein